MDPQREDDRWRELHELLGLPGDAPPPAKQEAPLPPAAPMPARHEPPPEPELIEEFEEVGRLEPMVETPPALPDEPAVDWEEELDEDRDDTPLEEVAPLATAELPEGQAERPQTGEDEKPRRGRRRRRRGRGRGGDRQNDERGEQRAETPRDGNADRRDRGPGRNEQQQRRPDRPQPVAQDVDELIEEQQPDAPRQRIPQSDTDFSDWNVPSWQELISALYRPDR